jgi:hypothetical protein
MAGSWRGDRTYQVIGVVAGGVVAIGVGVAVSISSCITGPAGMGRGSTPAEAAAAASRLSAHGNEAFAVTAVDEVGSWALVSGAVTQRDSRSPDATEMVAPDGVAYIAHFDGSSWQAVAPGTGLGATWLCQAPGSVVSTGLREYYLGPGACR